ncbi:hypothetical protein CTAYLR_000808 [Chrysophaeum taylorii]|uniref:Uncharacterized protein n=1 Tax=Chrysophaeum taylorii TaxID=2483200 RepID=A0AAD7UQ29_9STRA|nr:hypothetical protein CTAYLR_000808 [Chrysophaeum taylorii]
MTKETTAAGPTTPRSERKQSTFRPQKTPKSRERTVLESFDAFAAQLRMLATETEPYGAIAELVYRVGLEAVARRVPAPYALACEWLPRWFDEAPEELDARLMRRSIRAQCVRAKPLSMPAGGEAEVVADATLRRRRLRDVELQILLRAVLPTLGREAAEPGKRDQSVISLLLESASFDLQAPHVDCEARRRHNNSSPASPRTRGQYESLRTFFDRAIAPVLQRLAPQTLQVVSRSFEFDDDKPTPATVARRSAYDSDDDRDAPPRPPPRPPQLSTIGVAKKKKKLSLVDASKPPPEKRFKLTDTAGRRDEALRAASTTQRLLARMPLASKKTLATNLVRKPLARPIAARAHFATTTDPTAISLKRKFHEVVSSRATKNQTLPRGVYSPSPPRERGGLRANKAQHLGRGHLAAPRAAPADDPNNAGETTFTSPTPGAKLGASRVVAETPVDARRGRLCSGGRRLFD